MSTGLARSGRRAQPGHHQRADTYRRRPHAPAVLPFEGDRTPAVILSKAVLSAEDTEITDPTILRRL